MYVALKRDEGPFVAMNRLISPHPQRSLLSTTNESFIGPKERIYMLAIRGNEKLGQQPSGDNCRKRGRDRPTGDF